MAEENWGYLCCLINEAGGEVYQYQRLYTGVYALTNSRDRKGGEQIFNYSNYSFEIAGPFGMGDKELLQDMVSLDFLGLIERKRTKREEDKITHGLIKLTQIGKELAGDTIGNMPTKKIVRLKEVAEDLKSDVSATELLEKYGSEWSKCMLEQL